MTRTLRFGLVLALCAPMLLMGAPASADPPNTSPRPLVSDERPSPHYPSTLYADIVPTLTALAQTSERLRVEQIGRSAGGLPLLLATVSSPENLHRLQEVRGRRQAMIEAEPGPHGAAGTYADLPAIVLVNAGWQGNLYAGVDAVLAIVYRLALEDSRAVERILENVVLLVNAVPNPDGRVAGSAGNAADMEPAHDLVAQSQPETRAVVDVLASWSPMVVLDVDGLGRPMVIGASAPPRQVPSGDLYLAWSLDIAHAMSTAVHAASGYAPETVTLTPEAAIGEWPHLDLTTYAAYHGAYGFGLTVASRDASGVAALDAAIDGALAFVSQHREALVRDQARLLEEGLLRTASCSAPRHHSFTSSYTLYTRSTTHSSPAAYLIPADGERQQDRHEAAALVNLLIDNGVAVERTRGELTVRWKPVSAGAYLVRLDQPKGELAAALLWAPTQPGSPSDPRALSGWSLPLAWGVTCLPLDRMPDIATEPVVEARPPRGSVQPGPSAGYAYTATSNAAIAATNALLDEGVPLYWAPSAFVACQHECPAGTFVLPTGSDDAASAVALLTEQYGIHLGRVCSLPQSLIRLRPPRVAVHADPGVSLVLRDLGFHVSEITTEELSAGRELDSYDVLIVSGQAPLWERLSARSKHVLWTYLRRGGHYIGIGAAGTDLAVATGLADLDPTITSHHFAGMAAITCDRDDPLTASFPEHAVIFARAPVWFTYLPDSARPVAHLSGAGPLVTGYWPVWEDINPAGQPVIVHLPHQGGSLTLFGFDPTYNAYPRHAFRLLAQAIYRTMTIHAP